MALYRLRKQGLQPPAVVSPDAGAEDEIPWILIEDLAYVVDRRNSTTAFSDCGCVQVTLVVAPPPRVSYICVFCRRRGPRPAGGSGGDDDDEGQMISVEPDIIATDEDLVLLRIIVSDGKDQRRSDASGFFVYQPAGDGGPSLTRLGYPNPDPYSNYHFNDYQVGLVSCTARRLDDHNGSSGGGLSLPRPHFMVAALSQNFYDMDALGRGLFLLHLYNSKLQTWTAIDVFLSEQHYHKYQNEEGYFFHRNTTVITVGGEDATIAFVDLWRGILLCDLSLVQDQPWLRYAPLPHRQLETMITGDARLSRDIAVVDGHFKYVRKCRVYDEDDGLVGWSSAMFTRPVSACSLKNDDWEQVCHIESKKMDTEDSLNFHLLPKPDGLDGMPFSPLNYFHISQPTLSLDTDHTVCFMVKIESDDHKAWVITVDMKNNRLREVAEFDASRYSMLGFAYRHSKISKYLKMAQGTTENLKRQGIQLQGSHNKKLAWRAEMVGMAEGKGDGGAMLMG